jgi:hypothetical protein
MLKRTLFKRVRLVRPVIQFLYPEYLFNEKRLLEKIGEAESMKEIQDEVDFYQHKYVVNSVMKDALRFRISGMKIMSIANKAFNQKAGGISNTQSTAPVTD